MAAAQPPEAFAEDVRATAAIGEGWDLVKPDYWLFLGITVVGMLISSAFPIILGGPMLCGIYYCFMKLGRGERVEFGDLFRGFDYFTESLLAYLILFGFSMGISIAGWVIILISFAFFGLLATALGGAGAVLGVVLVILGFLVLMGLTVLLGAFTLFTFPLIVDRNMKAWEAIVTSFGTVKKHIKQVVLLCVFLALMGMVGMLACYIGAFFVMPVTFAAAFVFYRKLFPEQEVEVLSPGDEPSAQPL